MTGVILWALAAVVVVGAPPEHELRRLRTSRRHRKLRAPHPVAVSGVALVATLVGLGPGVAGWLLVTGVVAATAAWVVRGTRQDRRTAARRQETARAAGTLALLLKSGQIPTRALQDAASDCPVLAPAALTSRLGGDVTSALAELGAQDGRAGLARVSAAWRVSERTGAPMAEVLTGVAETLRQERRLASVVMAELAPARASGRIMALLPFVAIGVGVLVGADPLAFLLGSGAGQGALLAGVTLAAGGVVWTERIARSALTRDPG